MGIAIDDQCFTQYPGMVGFSLNQYEEITRAINRYLQELEQDASWRTPQNGSTFFTAGYIDYLDANFNPSAKSPQPLRTENRRNCNVFLELLEEE